MSRARVLIVDDHRLIAMAMSIALELHGFDVSVGPVDDLTGLVRHAAELRPQCTLLDIHFGDRGFSGLDLVMPLRRLGGHVVMVTSETDELILAACLEAGAAGWVAKDAEFDAVSAAIRRLLLGDALIGRRVSEDLLHRLRAHRAERASHATPFDGLSRRECEVLGALIEGFTAEEIATSKVLSVATVRTQIRSTLTKLGVHSQLAAVALARRHDWRFDSIGVHRIDTGVHQF